MSTTNWYTVRDAIATRLATATSLRQVLTAPNEEDADTASLLYPGAVVVKGRAHRVGDPFGGGNSMKYITRVEFYVFYYTSQGQDQQSVEDEIGGFVNAGRLVLEGHMPASQVDNSSLLTWESEDDLEKVGPRGDGTDGLKVKQTFSLDQVAFSVPS